MRPLFVDSTSFTLCLILSFSGIVFPLTIGQKQIVFFVMIGIGFDAHRFQRRRRLVLGGIEIPGHAGLAGHSDADVLIHAIIDAVLGAAGLRDIGYHFPDTDARWRGASSLDLLGRVMKMLKVKGLRVVNIDSCVIAETPKIAAYVERMRLRIARIAGISRLRVAIKGKTTEGMGFTGRGEGIAALAVCQLEKR